ncbi:DUF4136 domain-containing protein [Pedobacter sp. PAMC26386]|nr:DUF4136 domain-containing protein [Pedobacter sp. PAMC26386]
MKKVSSLSSLALLMIIFSSCTSLRTSLEIKFGYDYDKNVDFSKLQSYAIYDKGLANLELNSLDKSRLVNTVEEEMSKKGFTKVHYPNFLVNVAVITKEQFKSEWGYHGGGYQFDYTQGAYVWRSSEFGPGDSNTQYAEGTFIIDFLNPETKALLWHGQGRGFKMDDFNGREKRISELVKQLLAQYTFNLTTTNSN